MQLLGKPFTHLVIDVEGGLLSGISTHIFECFTRACEDIYPYFHHLGLGQCSSHSVRKYIHARRACGHEFPTVLELLADIAPHLLSVFYEELMRLFLTETTKRIALLHGSEQTVRTLYDRYKFKVMPCVDDPIECVVLTDWPCRTRFKWEWFHPPLIRGRAEKDYLTPRIKEEGVVCEEVLYVCGSLASVKVAKDAGVSFFALAPDEATKKEFKAAGVPEQRIIWGLPQLFHGISAY